MYEEHTCMENIYVWRTYMYVLIYKTSHPETCLNLRLASHGSARSADFILLIYSNQFGPLRIITRRCNSLVRF